jgi:hypothetical protein
LGGLGHHVIDVLRHIPRRMLLLNVDIGAIKVLPLFVIHIHVVLVDLIQQHQVYSLWIVQNTVQNCCLDSLLIGPAEVLLSHVVLAHFCFVVVLVSFVEKHRIYEPWISKGCAQVLKVSESSNNEEYYRKDYALTLEKIISVVIDQRYHERDLN